MMQEKELQELQLICQLLNIPIIDNNRKYWLVRTESGIYFDDFYFDNYIALGWDKIKDIKEYEQLPEKERNQKISELYPDEKRPGAIFNQICKFTYEMHAGDIVLIPSENSLEIAFGELVDDVVYPYFENSLDALEEISRLQCKYNRRRKVKWIKTVKRDSLDPYLYKLMCSHAAITDASSYSNYIDRTLMPVFIKNNYVHTIYDITTTENISALNMISFINSAVNTIDMFNQVTGTNYDKNEIDLKLNVQSPGPVEFIASAVKTGIIFASISALFFGANFNIELFKVVKFDVNTKGLLSSILEFIKEKNQNNQEILKAKNDLKKHKETLKAYAPYEERTTTNKKIDENQISIDDITN